MPKRGRSNHDALSPPDGRGGSPKRGRRSSSSSASGSVRHWADLPQDLLETIFVRLQGSGIPASQVCYPWRMASLSFPRPVVLNEESGSMRLLVPTTIMTRGVVLSQSISPEGRPFRFMNLPGAAIHSALRIIGGSPSLPLFLDDSTRRLVIQRVIHPYGELLNAVPDIWVTLDLPEGLDSRAVTFGVFALGNTVDQVREISNIRGVLIVTCFSIFGTLVSAYGVARQWARVTMPVSQNMSAFGVLPAAALLPPKTERVFTTGLSIGGLTYLLDQSHRLTSISLNTFGDLQVHEIVTNRNQLLDRNTRVLRTWLLQLPMGDEASGIVCLRYEHTRPRYYNFRAYEISLQDAGRTWRAFRDLANWCIFIGWGPGAQAFAYANPEKVGLTGARVYDSQQGFQSYSLNRLYRNNIMPASPTGTFPVWLQSAINIPYVPPPRYGLVAEALLPHAYAPKAGGRIEEDTDNAEEDRGSQA